ncbi:hypothetical protein NECAME_13013 [Necator americanus]|uniref:Pyridoxal-dependent decarboxylase domain protein n=1 Tax=Necator americanus TaxID=51031 RepID=W2T0C6_NECAM|nr:hypothetical protein NECAME_13013 [Necator americanus]ETN74417.1 hypothetical protein NECAME_13013 [Necator americanus]
MMRPPIILLKEGTENKQGKQQIISNINACQVVADSIRTTLGPRGLDKLIVDSKERIMGRKGQKRELSGSGFSRTILGDFFQDFSVVISMASLSYSYLRELVGSAPNFPFGTVDDIVAIGKLGLEYDIPVHVDACLGGFILPFLTDPHRFDFSVPGVCSISADTHKYGLSPKGSSVVLYRNKEYLHNQYFCDADWQGGIYASSTLEGEYKISEMPELRLQGASDVCIVSWTSDTIDIHRLYDLIGKKGWQLTNLQFPSGIHIMVTLNHTGNGVAENLLTDIKKSIDEIKANPTTKLEEAAALYGMAQKIPDRSIVQEFAYTYLDACYSSPKDVQG